MSTLNRRGRSARPHAHSQAVWRRGSAAAVATLVVAPLVAVGPAAPADASTLGTGVCAQEVTGTVTAVIEEAGDDCVVLFTAATGAQWTVPSGVTTIGLVVVGGGGAGGSASDQTVAGGGGGGEVVVETDFDVSTLVSLTLTVGSGGEPSTTGIDPRDDSDKTPGGDGSASSVAGGAGLAARGGAGGARGSRQDPQGSASTTGFTGGGGAAFAWSWSAGSDGVGGTEYGGGDGRRDNDDADRQSGGGGGGADGVGGDGTATRGGAGGSGRTVALLAGLSTIADTFGGGGGGGKRTGTGDGGGLGGSGGGGAGGAASEASAGEDGLGGGGGGASGGGGGRVGGAGGSGAIIIRYERPAVPAVSAAPAPPPVLTCEPAAVAPGDSMICRVDGGPAATDILWSAVQGGSLVAGTGVLTDQNGTAEFAFVVPDVVRPGELEIVLVEWTRPITVTVDGPRPTEVPAGLATGGMPSRMPGWAALQVLVVAAIVLLLRQSWPKVGRRACPSEVAGARSSTSVS